MQYVYFVCQRIADLLPWAQQNESYTAHPNLKPHHCPRIAIHAADVKYEVRYMPTRTQVDVRALMLTNSLSPSLVQNSSSYEPMLRV